MTCHGTAERIRQFAVGIHGIVRRGTHEKLGGKYLACFEKASFLSSILVKDLEPLFILETVHFETSTGKPNGESMSLGVGEDKAIRCHDAENRFFNALVGGIGAKFGLVGFNRTRRDNIVGTDGRTATTNLFQQVAGYMLDLVRVSGINIVNQDERSLDAQDELSRAKHVCR